MCMPAVPVALVSFPTAEIHNSSGCSLENDHLVGSRRPQFEVSACKHFIGKCSCKLWEIPSSLNTHLIALQRSMLYLTKSLAKYAADGDRWSVYALKFVQFAGVERSADWSDCVLRYQTVRKLCFPGKLRSCKIVKRFSPKTLRMETNEAGAICSRNTPTLLTSREQELSA